MQNFDTSDLLDEDEVEIIDLDSLSESSSVPLSVVLLKFVRRIPFLANTRTKNTALALMMCAIVLLFLVQPDLPSTRVSGTLVATQSSSPLLASPAFIEHGSAPRQVIWIKISNGVETVMQAPAGIIVWHGCKLLNWHIPPKYTRPMIVICK
jgi:hypothetical protein